MQANLTLYRDIFIALPLIICQHLPLGKYLIIFKGHVPNTKYSPPIQKGRCSLMKPQLRPFAQSNIHLCTVSVIFLPSMHLICYPSTRHLCRSVASSWSMPESGKALELFSTAANNTSVQSKSISVSVCTLRGGAVQG